MSFSTRRKARKIGQDDDESEPGPQVLSTEATGSPISKKSTSHKPKKRSSLRLSFGPGQTSMIEDISEASEVFTPKKSSLARHALEKSAQKRSLGGSHLADLPLRASQAEDRPTYSKDYLDQLKSSTPSTPKSLRASETEQKGTNREIDIASKFGPSMDDTSASIIPSEAEIREKKERRARLAREQDFISLDDGEPQEISLFHRKKTETRLVRDDEDFAEGFGEFVDDGKISLSRKAKREQRRRHKEEMRQMIDDAEGSSDEDSDDSDFQRKAAFEAAQTRSGMDGLQRDDDQATKRPRTPPKLTPLPTLSTCLERLQSTLTQIEYTKMQRLKKLADLQKQKADVAVREIEIQRLLQEAGENYEKLRAEAGLGNKSDPILSGTPLNVSADQLSMNRGLESFGNTPIASARSDE
ncbi:MAG: hypothetical protein M1834_002301 [Cirrosporium novae-zelandiae]|nr:MAG: hypothetical protein M1834_002301 [Cirrosporium novae-zelandiae]